MAKPNKQNQNQNQSQNQKPKQTTISEQARTDDIQKSDTTPMIFSENKYINGVLFAAKGQLVQVPNASVDRWIKRGGAIVGPGEEKPVEVPVEPVEETPKADEDKGKFVDPEHNDGDDGDHF